MANVALKIDQQNDFVYGSLANPAAADKVDYLVAKAQRQIADNWQIYVTRDTHSADPIEYQQTLEGRSIPPHCCQGSDGWQVVPALDKLYRQAGGEYIDKVAFGSPLLVRQLQVLDQHDPIAIIELDGFVTEICVISNALLMRANFPEVKIVVDAAGCAGLSRGAHDAALMVMKANLIEVINQPE
jgi:nicotinamidase-related amidase